MQTETSVFKPPIKITAGQVVFTNVEADESPNGVRGFQTVFFSEGIDKEVLQAEIEPALQYFPRNGRGPGDSPQEYVFFSLSSLQVVVGCITPLLDKLDKFLRKKMLFAHALVFDAKDFLELLDNNPFAVIDADPFLKSYEQALQEEDVKARRQRISARSLEITPVELSCNPNDLPRHWLSGENLRRLVLMASAAHAPKRSAFAWEVHGSPEAFLALTRSCFGLFPPEFRAAMSFDTNFVGDGGQAKSSKSAFRINGVGAGQRLQQDAVIRVYLEKDSSDIQEFNSDVGTPFERWLAERPIENFELALSPSMSRQLCVASLFQDLFLGRRIPPNYLTDSDRETFDQFLSCNLDFIKTRLLKSFEKLPGASLSKPLAEQALEWIRESGAKALEAVPRRFPHWQMSAWLLPRYERAPRLNPEPLELEALVRCCSPGTRLPDAMSADERLLHTFCLTWQKNWKELQAFVAILDRAEFERFANWVVIRESQSSRPVTRILGKIKLFFGFRCKLIGENGNVLLRLLTFYPLAKNEVVPTSKYAKEYYRKYVLQLLHRQAVGNQKKNDGSELPTPAPRSLLDRQPPPLARRNWGEQQFQFPTQPRSMIVQVRADGVAFQVERSLTAPGLIPIEFSRCLTELCRAGNHHVAFFCFGQEYVVAEMRKVRDVWTILLIFLNAYEFKQGDHDPLTCLRRAFGGFVGSASSVFENQPLDLNERNTQNLHNMVSLVSRNIPFLLKGTTTQFQDTLELLFQILPHPLRAHCSYFSDPLPAENALRILVTRGSSADQAAEGMVSFDLTNGKTQGLPDTSDNSLFDRTISAASGHSSWPMIWPKDARVFQQLYELSRLSTEPVDSFEDRTISLDVYRLFFDLNGKEIREAIYQRLVKQVGEALSLVLLNKACFWLKEQPPESFSVLSSGFSEQWLVQQTVAWLLNEQIVPLSREQLADLEILQKSLTSENSSESWVLKAVYGAVAHKPGLLMTQIAKLETEDYDTAVQMLTAVCQRAFMQLRPDEWCFRIETQDPQELKIGVELQFHPIPNLEGDDPRAGLFAALFGCRVARDQWGSGPSLLAGNTVSGRYWPDLIAMIHASFSQESGEQHVAT
jgi:hypothetical protein